MNFAQGRDVFVSLPAEKPLLFSASLVFQSSEKLKPSSIITAVSPLFANEGPGVQHYDGGIISGICGGAVKQ